MALPPFTLPCLGQLNIPVGLAPFQFPYSAPNLGKPYFLNGTSQPPSLSLSPGSGGFISLKYAYGNVPLSTGATTAQGFLNNSQMPAIQFAGGIVQSFGVFDYLMLAPNPFAYNGGVHTNFYNGGSYTLASTPGGCYYSPVPLVTNFNQIVYDAVFSFPDFLTSDVSTTFSAASKWNFYAGSETIEFVSSGAIAYYDPGSLSWQVGNMQSQLSEGNVNPYVLCSPYSGGPIVPTLTTYNLQTVGIYPGMSRNDATGGICMSLLSPRANTWLLAFEPSTGKPNLCVQPLFTTSYNVGTDPTLSRIPLVLAVASDNALVSPAGFADSIRGTVDPQGNFLITPFTGFTTGGNIWFYILSDLSGYYRVVLTGNTGTIQSAINNGNLGNGESGGFGIDGEGNFWLIQPGQQQPQLYSSVNLGSSLAFPALPNVTVGWLGCRDPVCWPWFG